MIMLDGLRKDRLSLCPELMKIARNSYFFSKMNTAATYTLASMHSIFSGVYPYKNGVNGYYKMFRFRKGICKTFTEYLAENNYHTVIDTNEDAAIPRQGFNEIRKYDEYKEDVKKRHKELVSEISRKKKFFLCLHYVNLHTHAVLDVAKKYTDFSEEFFNNTESNRKRYNSYLKELDDYIKTLFSKIDELNLKKNTLIVVLTDHGMSNGERVGEKMYGSFLYNYTLNTFCLFCLPDKKNKEITFRTRTVDIMPTILDIIGIKIDNSHEPLDGKSLMPYINEKEKQDRVVFAETGGLSFSPKEHNLFCIIKKDWKLIYNKISKNYELYNLGKDPDEKANLADEKKDIVKELDLELSKIMKNR